MSAVRLAWVVVALTLLPACSALAAQPWSPPASVMTGNPQVDEPTIAFGNNGRALLSARSRDRPVVGFPRRGFSRLLGQQPDGSFIGRGRVVLAAPPAVYGQSRLALVRLPLSTANFPQTTLSTTRAASATASGEPQARSRSTRGGTVA
jgi:hypothetical protein